MSNNQTLAKVISVCSSKDIQTWAIAANYINQFIDANEYLVVVPDHEVDLFRSVTCQPYKVIPESIYVGELKSRLKQLLPVENQDRIGWYLQQFIKIAAAKIAPSNGDINQLVLIWDADTVPLKKLNFVDSQGRVLYYSGTENHAPYFDFIKRIFPGLERQRFSFIAQCFPAKISWIQDFCKTLGSKEVDWIESIILNLDQSQRAGFSEYESLGTFIWNNHREEVALNHNAWERNGRSLVGTPNAISNLVLSGLASQFDFISFEAWDTNRNFKSRVQAVLRRFKFALIGFNNRKNSNV